MDLTYKLPQEILEKILWYLDTRDLCNFIQLSKRCYNVGVSHKLWANTRISKKYMINRVINDNESPLPDIPRFKEITHVDLSYLYLLPKDWCTLLYSVINTKQIESLDISYGQNLEYVEEALIGDALASIRTVYMNKINLSDHRLENVLKAIIRNKITKELHVSMVDLSQVPAQVFKDLVDSLEFLNVKSCYLDDAHVRYLFNMNQDRKDGGAKIQFSCESTQINDTISACDDIFVRDLLPNLFSSVTKLEFKLVDFSAISTELWCFMIRRMTDNLESLSIEGMGLDLVNVPGVELTNALVRVKELHLSGPDMSPTQWTTFFQKLTSKTQVLGLRMVNLSGVDVKLVGQALAKVRNVTLNYVCFECDQWNYLFQNIFPSIPNVSVVNINLSEIQDESIGCAARWCTNLNLSSTYLNTDQRNLLLNKVKENTRLSSLNLAGLNLADMSPDLLANVVASVPVVNLAATKLASKQVTAIFSRLLGSCKLRELDLGGLSLGQVPSRLLALALSRLRRVNLLNTIMSRDQLHELINQIRDNYSVLEYLALTRNMLLINRINPLHLAGNVYLDLD